MKSFYFSSQYYNVVITEFFKSLKLFVRVVKLMLPAANIVKDLSGKKNLTNKNNTAVDVNDGILPFAVNSLVAPFGIDVVEFCNLFNEVTKKFKKGLLVRVFIFLLLERKFFIEVKISSTTFLLKMYKEFNTSKTMTLLNLYKIYLINSFFFNVSERSIAKMLFGTLKSFEKLQIKI